MIGKLDLYRIFKEVALNKSISKAAQELYLTQSAVSQAILKLEKELDITLFYRTPKGVTLTTEGILLYEHVNSAMNILNTAEEKMMEAKNLITGALHIGVGDTISRYYLLPYLEEFYTKYPGIKLKIINGTTTEICEFIKEGKADVGICNLPIQDAKFHFIPCQEVHDIFVCGEKYKHLTSQPISLSDLMCMPLIFLEKNSNSRKYVELYLKEQGHLISPDFELGSHDLLLEFAKINLGIACVTKEFSEHYLLNGILHEIKLIDNIPKRNIGICYAKTFPVSRATKKFIEIIDPHHLIEN